MKIGTVRPEEAIVHDAYEGYHQFETDKGDPYGSFEVFWAEEGMTYEADGVWETSPPGWYWWACFPGCVPDGDPIGPFASSTAAYFDAKYED